MNKTPATDSDALNPLPRSLIPNLVSVQALAGAWRVREDTLRAWARAGKIRSVKIGRKILIDVASLPNAKE